MKQIKRVFLYKNKNVQNGFLFWDCFAESGLYTKKYLTLAEF